MHPPSVTTTLPNPSPPETNPKYTKDIETLIETHPYTRTLLNNPGLVQSRPHLSLPSSISTGNLLTGPLSGVSKISVAPYIFTSTSSQTLYMIIHLGSNLCGHPGMIHGGLLATLLDEGFARCCFPHLPEKVGVTASLGVQYKAPAMADGVFVLIAETMKVEGRKAWVSGRIERLPLDLDGDGEEEGTVVVEAEGLFVQPRSTEGLRGLYNAA